MYAGQRRHTTNRKFCTHNKQEVLHEETPEPACSCVEEARGALLSRPTSTDCPPCSERLGKRAMSGFPAQQMCRTSACALSGLARHMRKRAPTLSPTLRLDTGVASTFESGRPESHSAAEAQSFGWDFPPAIALDVRDKIGDGCKNKPVLLAERDEIRYARHASIVINHLAQYPGRL